jgi:large subunit ribosomal protein L23
MNAVAKKEAAPKAAKKAPAKKSSAKTGTVAEARLYDVLVRPIVTEKSAKAAELNKITFAISPTATKFDVKQAVEKLFNVEVSKVNTISIDGKVKRFRGQLGQRSNLRKAVVTLAAGQSIDLQAGLK